MRELEKLLDQVLAACRTAANTDLSEFINPEEKRLAIYEPSIRRLMQALKTEMEKVKIVFGNAYGQMFHFTAVPEPDKNNIPGAIKTDSNRAEIRQSLRGMEREAALDLIETKVKQNDLSFLHAVQTDPTQSYGSDFTNRLRLEYTRRNKPELMDNYEKAELEYNRIRANCAVLSGQMTKGFIDCGLENPIKEAERIEIFPPQSDLDASLVRKRLEKDFKEEVRSATQANG